jgi:hypothetical protein
MTASPAPAMPSEEEIARLIAPAAFKAFDDDYRPGQNAPTFTQMQSIGSMNKARDTARAVLALFAPVLVEKEREIDRLQATVRKAHVAMTLACALPVVASEYDFSEAIASTEATLARRAAAIRAQGE